MWAKITKPTESIVSSSSSRKPRSSTSSRRDPSPDVSRAAESRSRRHSDAPKHDGDRRRDRSKSRDRQRSRSRERHSTHDKDKEERRRHHSRRATDPDEISRSSADQPSSHDAAASSSREDGKRRRSSHHHEKKRERASSRATADETDRAGEFQAQVGAQGFTQFPGQYDAALPGAGAPRPTPVSSHVPDQFPGQFPAQSTAPYRPPLGINEGGPGLAADYYGDQGESVLNQPGVRPPASTVIVGTQPHLQSASATPAPPPEPSAVGGVGAAASFFSGEGPTESPQSSFKPPKPGKTNKPSKVSGSAVAAGTAALGYAVASSGPSSSSSHHGSSQAHSTSAGISRPPAGGNQSASAPIIPTLGAAAAGAAAGYMAGQYGQSGGPPQSDQNSAYFSAASNIPSRPAAHPGPFNPPPPQPGPPSNFPSGEASGKHSGHSNAGLYAAGAVGAAALAAHQLHHSSSHHSVGGGPSSGNVSYKHRPKGPLSRIANFWRDPDGVAQFEEYTEYIGVCRYCFSPDSSPRDAPRVHHYKRGKRVDKERRYDRRYSSDSSSGKRRNKSWIATGLAGYGIAKFGKSLWNSRDFDDTYSVKSGRSSTASLPGSLGGKSKVSRGNTMRRSRSSSRHRGDSVVIGRSRSKERHRSRSKDRVETGITGDGRAYRKDLKTGVTTYVEDIGRRRSRSRSRSRSRHRQDGLVAAGIGISSIGISSAVASHSRHRSRGTSPRRDFVREKRTKSRERDSHHDRQHSYHADISRSNRTSNTGMLGGFFSAPSEKRRRKSPSKRSKKGIFNIGSNSSSSDLDMAFGTGNDRSKKSQKSQKSDRKSRRSDDAAILGLSAAAVAIAAGQSGRGKHDKRMPELVAVKESKNRPQGHPERSGRGHGSAHSPDASGPGDEDWESATDDEGSSASDLAFGSFYDKGKLPHRRSRGSLTSDASSSSGNWGRLWGSKRSKKRGETSYTSDSASRTQSFIGPASAGLAGAAVGAVRVDRRASGPDVAGSSVSSSFAPLRQLYPVPTSDPNSFDARQRESISSFQNLPLHTSRPGPVPVQHPQPYTPVSSAVFAGQIPASPGYTAPTGPPVFSQAPIQPYRPESQAALVDSPKTYRSNDPFNYQVKDDAWETENASRDTVGGLQRRKSSLSNGAAAATAITEPKRRTTAPNEPSGVRFDLTKEQAEKQAREAGKSSERPREEGESKRDRAKRREAEEKAALEKVRESSRPERRRSRDAEPPSSSRTEAYRDDDGKSNDAWVAPVEAGMVGAAMAVAAANPSSSRGEARQERRRNDDGQPRYEALYDVKRDEQDRTAGEGYRQTDIARKAASKVVASRAQEVQSVLDKYTGTQQTQAEFFAPPELLDKSADRSQPTVPVFDSDFMSFDVPQIIEVAPPDAFAGPTHPPSFSLNAASMSLPWMVPRLNLISPTPMPRSPLLLPADAPGASAPSPEKSPPSQEPWDAKRTAERTVGSESESQERSKPKDAGSEPKRHHREEQPEAPVSGFGHVPGEFGDDVDFAASLAAGLQDSGFDPSIVTDNPSYWRRDSPPGSEGPGGYKKPFSETVSDLGSFAPDVTAVKTAPPSRDHGERRIEGDSELRKQELRGSDESKVSKQEGKKGRKAASRVLDEEAVEAKQSELARTSVDPPGAYNAVAESETYFDATSIPENESSELVRDKSRRMKDDVPPVPREAASGIAGVAAGVLAAMKSTGIPRSAESDRASEDYDQREQASDDVERSKKQGRKSKGERGATNEEPGTPVENSSETGQPRGAAEAGVDQYEELTRNGKKSKGRDLTEDIQVDVAQSKGQWPGEAPDSFPESYEEPRRKGKKSKKIASKNGVASDLPGVAPGAKSDELDEPMRKGKKSKSRGNDDPSPDAERLSRLTLGASESTFNDHEEPKRKGKKSKRRPTDEPLDDSEGPSQLTSGASGFEANAYEEPSRKSEKSRSKSAADSNDTRVSVRDSSAAASGNFEEPKRKSKKSKSKANSDDFYDDLDRSTRSANDGAERGIPDLSDDPEDRKSRMSRENKDKRKSRGDEVLETGRITQDQEIKEFRPLYLVERHASKHEIERGEEQYPPLPSSHATSRTPSVDDAEEGTMDRGFQKEPLVFNDLDFGQPNRDKIMGDDVARPAPDVLDSAKSTPRAETFRTQLGMERGTEDIPSWEKFSDSHQGLVENDRQADTSGVSQASELLAKDAEAGFQTDQNEEDAAESGWSTSKPPQSKEDDKTKKAKKGKNRKGQAVSPRDESPLRDASVEAANVEVLTDVDTVVPLGEKAPGLEEQTPVQAAEGLSSLTKKSKKDKKGKKGKATATPEPPEVPLPTPSTPKTMEVSSVAPKSAVLSALVEAATKVPDQANKGGITSREPSRPEDEVILVPETKKSKKEKKSKKKKGVDTPPLNIIDAPSGLTMMDTDLEKPSGKAASELAASESVAELDVEYVTPGKKNKKKGKKALGISPPQAFGSASSLAAGQTVAQVESSQGRSEERGLDEVAGPDDKFTEIEKSQKAILVSASEKIKSLTTASERQIVDGEVSSRPIPDSVAKTNRDSLARGSEHNGQGTGNLTQQAQGAMVNSSKLDDETVEEMVRAPEPVTVIPTEAVDVKFSMPGAMKTEKGQKSLLLSGPDEIDTPTTGDRVAEERPSELLADAADSGDVNATFSTRGNKEKEGRRADLASPPRGLESPLKEVIADEPSTSRREDKIPDKDLEFSTPGKKKKKGKKGLVSQTPDDTDFASPPAVNKVVLEETEPSMKTALTSIPGDEFASLLPGKKSKTKGKRPSFTSEPDESENRSASSDKGVLVEDSSKEIAAATVGLGESFDASFPTTVKKKNGKKAQRASVVAQTQASVVENGAEVTTSHHGSESKVSEADQVTDLSVVQDGPAGDRRSPAEQSRRLDPEVMSSFLSRDEEQAILPQSVPLPTTDDDDLNELPGLREVGDFSVPLQQSLSVQDEIDGASRPVVQDPEQAKPLDPTSIPLPLGDELEIRELIDDIPPILDLAGSRANLRSQAPAPLPVLLPVAQKQSISAPGRNFADDPIRDRGEAKEPPEPEGGTGGFWGLLTKKGKRDKAAESTKKTDAPSKLEQATTNPQASEQISHEKSPGPSGQRLPETQFLTQAATSQLENVEPHEHDRNADSPKPEASDTPEASADHEAEVRGDESWTTSSKKKDKKSKKSRRAFEPAVDLAVVDSVRDLDQGAKSADARGTALENQPGWKDKKDLKKGKKAREVKNKPSDNLAEASAPEHVRNLPPERVSREDVPISIPTEKDDAREGVEQIIPEETVQPLSETLTPKRSKKNKKAKAGRMSYDEPKEPAASKEILEASENLSTRKVVERDLATFKTTKEPAEAEVARDEIEGDLVLNKLTPKENKKARTASRKDDEPIKPFESIPSSKGEDDLATRDRSLQDLVAAETASEKVVDKITADSKPSKNDEEVKKSKSRLLADGEGHRIPDALPAPEVTTRRDEQPGETASNLFGEQFHFNAAPRLERPVEKAQTRIVDADNHQVSGEQANRFVMPGSFDSPSDTAPQRQELDSRRGERPVDIVPGFARKASLATAAGIALFESLTKGKTSLQTETAKVDSAKEETRPAAIVDPENATTRAIVDRDSAIAVAESPTQSSRTSQQAFVRDSGYQDASPSAAAKQGQFPASAESVIESREAPRDGHDRDTSLEIDSTIRKRTESQESSESRRRADTMEGSTGPLDITVEMDPTYELSISRHSGDRARSKSGSRKSVEISWQPEEALWDSNENSNVDKSRNVGPPRSTEDLPPPSPITSTSKDRNSYLFNSSPSTRDDQANQQASRVRSTSQTDRQIIPDLGPATGEGGDGQGPHEHHAKDNERDDAYDVPRDTTSRSVSSRGVAQAEQPARPSLFGGPIGVNSDRQSAPVTSAEFTPPERRRLNTIREQSPDESPRTRRVRGERRDELRYDAQREDSSPLQLKHPLGKNLTPATDPERRAKDNKLVSTDELISRLSWPSVDENEETVNIERVKSRDTDRRASSRHSDRSASVPKPRETDRRSPGVHSDLSDASVQRLQTPDREPFRPQSELSNRSNGSSGTPPLRRIDRSLSGDLRAASRLGQAKLAKDAIGPASHVERDRNNTHDPTPSSSSYDPVRDKGKGRDRSMADVYVSDGRVEIGAMMLTPTQEGWGDVQGSPLSPTRPPSMRRRQSMQLMELEGKFEQLAQDNRQLEEARARAEKTAYDAVYEKSRAAEAAAEALQSRDQLLHERDSEIEQLKELLDRLRGEVSRLTEVTEGLRASGDGHEERYGLLQAEHAATRGSLEELRQVHGKLSTGMETVVRQEIDSALADKSAEVRRLRDELETTRGQVRTLQQQLLASKPGDNFLTVRDEDYFEGACQQLCQHVQQFVLRFSKFSDMRGCRLADEVRDDSIFERLDNAILDGSDVDGYLADRVKRRDVFMSVVMMMVWESIFARYLFGMDREQRQKLKALEKILAEVGESSEYPHLWPPPDSDIGPPAAVHQWRATTLTLLSRREAFQAQREQDTEVVVQDVYHTLAALLPPPSNLTGQIQDSLRKVMRAAVELSIEMRTQRAGYMMLPPLQPEYDASGELERQVQFRASLMNERSGATTSNEELEERGAIVRMVLFPLVVKRGEDDGTGDDEIVVCPAQVLVAPLHAGKERESGSGKKVVRVLSGDRMSLDERSMAQSSAMDLGNMI
ncbi:MAG: hypothetical protein M1832_001529 [Thelocarpon impressellum]|nr:MAG: hypothetical protein M1832_001529 [Thelocarpon impressellum]